MADSPRTSAAVPAPGLRAAVTAVRALHAPRHFLGDGYGWSLCTEDRQQWPCATEQAIREALGES